MALRRVSWEASPDEGSLLEEVELLPTCGQESPHCAPGGHFCR